MEIRLYKFSKKINSTKRPTTTGTVVNCSIKSNVPVANSFDQSADTYLTMPVFFISVDGNTTEEWVKAFNYVQAFGYYYWVNNVEIGLNGVIILYCTIDALASARDDIIGTEQYVTYSTAHGDSSIDDGRNLGKLGSEYREVFSEYILGFTARDELMKNYNDFYVTMTHDKGSQVLYMSQREFYTSFYPALLTAWAGGSNTWAAFYGAPLYAIGQVMASMVDNSFGSFSIEKEAITIGGSSLGSYYTYTQGWQMQSGVNVPLAAFSRDYRDGDRLAMIYVYLPFAGLISIEPSKVFTASQLKIRFAIDYGTMDIGYIVLADYGDYDAIVGEAFGNCGRNVPFGQIINPNTAAGVYFNAQQEKLMGQIAGAAISGMGEAASDSLRATGGMVQTATNVAGQAIAGTVANLINAKESGYSQGVSGSKIIGGSFGGSIGGLGGLKARVYELRQRTMYTANSTKVANTMGLPTNKVVTLSADGFYQIPNPIIELDTVSSIIDIIIKYMKGGIFIE